MCPFLFFLVKCLIQIIKYQNLNQILQTLNLYSPMMKQKMRRTIFYSQILLLTALIFLTNSAIFTELGELIQERIEDETEVIRLATDEKFTFPLNGRYISYDIQYYPTNSEDCVFNEPRVQYKKLAESNTLFEEQQQVVDILVLKKSQKAILADPYFNIVFYSIDEHSLLKILSPKTSLLPANNKKKKLINTLSMVASENQDHIYYLSPNNSFVFSTKSFGTKLQKLEIQIPLLRKAIHHKGYIIVLTVQEGLIIFKVINESLALQKVQVVPNKQNFQYIDIELDCQNDLIYVLTNNNIEVYAFSPSQFPDPKTQQFITLRKQDEINLYNRTRNHNNFQIENNQHLALEIAVNPKNGQTSLFIMFRHNMRQNIIAEFIYYASKRQIVFLRYFKFQMVIKDIHTVEDVVLVVGNEVLGMFPYGIDPRLIREEFNGWIALSNIERIAIAQAPYFVGVTKNTIEYGGLLFSKQSGLNCQFTTGSLTRSINFKANLTWCNEDDNNYYNSYCSYHKKISLEPMQIVTSSKLSSTIWIIMLICTVSIILGIFLMLVMHKRKEEEIKKLQIYFEQKRRTEVPQSSDRRSNQM